MNVRFGDNYWGSKRRGNASEKVIVNKYFTWAGRDWRIPAVYICEEGIVVDYCVRILLEEIQSFLGKWSPRMQDSLSDEEQMRAEQENPFQLEFREKAWINGVESPERSSCGTAWYPSCLHEAEFAESPDGVREAALEVFKSVEEELMEVYECNRNFGWKFWRSSFAWPEGVKDLASLEIVLGKEPMSYPGPHFKSGPGAEGNTMEFIHPGTGVKHMLTVHGWEKNSLPEHVIENMPSARTKILKAPGEFIVMQYSVEPEISQEELQIHDCAPSDPPVIEKKCAAGSVSVIGGASGPTSIFLAGKSKDKCPDCRCALSSLHYEAVEDVEWRMEFFVKDEQEIKVEIV